MAGATAANGGGGAQGRAVSAPRTLTASAFAFRFVNEKHHRETELSYGLHGEGKLAMPNEYVWLDIRDSACERFGSEPNANQQQRIVAVFEQAPALVQASIDSVATGYAQGTVRVPWAVVAADSERRLRERKQAGEIRANDPREKDRRLMTALERIHRGEFETRAELLDGLFGAARLSADVETLERIELETRASPSREMFEAALMAQLYYTRRHGRIELPADRDAPLYRYDTAWLRERMLAEWRQANLR